MSDIVRHIVNMSGGKDSTALAVYLKDKNPDQKYEFVFCDTGKELPETYEYLKKVENYLGEDIVYLDATSTLPKGVAKDNLFDFLLDQYSGFLPSAQMRWCTRELKIKPFEKYIKDDKIISYVGIRADENREGYISKKDTITAVFPFKEDGITLEDVKEILDKSGLGYPEYYEWRTRSGCYFCFFQRKAEWVGLLKNHPDLYKDSKKYEKTGPNDKKFTWAERESLDDIEKPDRVKQILENKAKAEAQIEKFKKNKRLSEKSFNNTNIGKFENNDEIQLQADEDDMLDACTICTL